MRIPEQDPGARFRTGLLVAAGLAATVSACSEDSPMEGETPNRAPHFERILLSSDLVLPGDRAQVTAVVSDPDGGSLTVAWSASAGSLAVETGTSTTWHAPDTSTTAVITGTVSDGAAADTLSDSLIVRPFAVLEVTSSPPGARILIDETDTGIAAPAVVAPVDTGGHAVRVERVVEEIFLPAVDSLSLASGDTVALHYRASLYRLTTAPADDYFPSFSPDGNLVVFTSDRNGSPDLWRVATEGDSVGLVVGGPGEQSYPTWSLDGSRVLFQNDAVCMKPDCREVWTHSLVTALSTPVSLPDTLDPALPVWNPADENRIAFQADEEIWIYDLALDSLFRVTDDLFLDQHPRWSPSGDTLLFSSQRPGGGPADIYGVTFSPPDTSLLVERPAESLLFPGKAPVGELVSFQTQFAGEPMEIYLLEAGTPGPLVEATAKAGPNWNAVWSPADTMMAFASGPPGERDIWISRELADFPTTLGEDLRRIWRERGVAEHRIPRMD
jgi:hypothetical protein